MNTKLCVFGDTSKITKEVVMQKVKKSRERVGGKIDLLQFFWADPSDKKFVDCSLWLAELREQGMFGELGVTNFNLKALKKMQDAGANIKVSESAWFSS